MFAGDGGDDDDDDENDNDYYDDFQNSMKTSLSKDTFVVRFSQRSGQFFQRYEPNCGKMPYLATLKNPSKKFLDYRIRKLMTSEI